MTSESVFLQSTPILARSFNFEFANNSSDLIEIRWIYATLFDTFILMKLIEGEAFAEKNIFNG